MTQEDSQKHHSLSLFSRYLLLTRSVSLISSIGLISTGMVFAQNQPVDNSFSIPTTPPTTSAPVAPPRVIKKVTPPPAPTPRRVVSPPAPRKVTPPAPAPRRVSAPAPAPRKVTPPVSAPRRVSAPAPAPVPRRVAPTTPTAAPTAPTPRISIQKPTANAQKKPAVSAPRVSVPAPTVSTPRRVAIPAEIDRPPQVNIRTNPSVANGGSQGGKNSYIDSQNYNVSSPSNNPRPTTRQNRPLPTVVLTERRTGCNTVSRNGQLAQGSCNISAKKPQTTNRRTTTRRTTTPVVASARTTRPVNYRPVNYKRNQAKSPGRLSNPNYKTFALGQVNNTSSTKTYRGYSDYYAKTGRPVYATNGNSGLLFPLSIPAAITSAFGWRTHPISGDYRMHTGTDIAAPMGTPVLAAYIGRVAYADYMGGYGLTVVVRHTEEGNQESRYAHLSQIFVQPGEVVQQGEIIGLVGSTGNSTGPHLHFEWRHLMPNGWVPVDAGMHIEYAMQDLEYSLKAAQLNPVSSKEDK